MQIKLLSDNILIKPVRLQDKISSLLVIPAEANKVTQQAEVIAIGPGKRYGETVVPMDVQVGDKVYIKKYSGKALKLDGVEYMIIHEADVLSIIE